MGHRPGPEGGDHPRSRGVYGWRLHARRLRGGSSPLARGLHTGICLRENLIRIIPARAGFTWPLRVARRGWRDHPRSRGVYGASSDHPLSVPGSSPLARGLHRQPRRQRQGPGIIPARAGFTRQRGGYYPAPEDHPRSRGVYASTSAPPSTTTSPACHWGSSPLARGLRRRVGLPHRRPRIIPARAGFTGSNDVAGHMGRDHPRSRGVYTRLLHHPAVLLGSSPLARGLLEAAAGVQVGVGIIPARAGFTTSRRPTIGPSWDHPRSRGVYFHGLDFEIINDGSSPLARGLR